MILFPSGDSQTERRDPPWASIIITGITLACYFLVLVPLKKEARARKTIAQQELIQALGEQFRQGNLSNDFWENAQADFRIIGKLENREIFSREVFRAWRDLEQLPQPLNILKGKDPIQKLLMILTPHEEGVLLVGVICLLLAGYFFEHLYDRQVLLALFFLSGGMWLVLESYAPAAWWPSPVFAWSNTILTLLLTIWLKSPKGTVTITFRTWFFKVIQSTFNLALVFLPIGFGAFLVYFNLKHSVYQSEFSVQTMVAPVAESLVFMVFLMGISFRDVDDKGPEARMNRQFAMAESYFEKEQREEGKSVLVKLLANQPSISQVKRAGELAWKNHEGELAQQAYNQVLRDAINGQDLVTIIKTIEDMAYKDLSVPGSSLNTAMMAAMKKNMLADVRNLLPYYRSHIEIAPAEVIQIHEDLVAKITAQSHPNKEFLYECQAWLETNAPESEAILKAVTFFEVQARASESFSAVTSMHLIHKHVDIKLLEITNNYIALKLQGQDKVQNVPWTAVEGIFGCHVTRGDRGYRGSVFLKFKRKIFSCNFTRQSIMVKDRFGQPVGFEAVWEAFKAHRPEDIPFIDLNEFEDLDDVSNYPRLAQEFIDR